MSDGTVVKMRRRPTLDPRAPLEVARCYVADRHALPGAVRCALIHHHAEWRRWTGSAWPAWDEAAVRADVYHYLDTAMTPEGIPYRPSARRVSDVIDALRAVVHLDAEITSPAWLSDQGHVLGDIHPARLIAAQRCIIDPQAGHVAPATPELYVARALPHEYTPGAAAPREWLAFLGQLWPDDSESVETLRRWMAYCLTTDTRLQVMLWVIGPPRAGKGIIARILRALLGESAVAGPTLSALGDRFGVEPLIDRPLAIIDDARLPRADAAMIIERLLTIVGEGLVTTDRKFRPAWTGRLSTRLMLLANELPRLPETSGALLARLRVLRLTRSWVGCEDRGLGDRLERELPGILRWAVEGYRAIAADGWQIRQPTSGADLVDGMRVLSAPLQEFIADELEVAPDATSDKTTVYERWRRWCGEQGIPATSAPVFARDLRAAIPTLRSVRPGSGDRVRQWEGVGFQ